MKISDLLSPTDVMIDVRASQQAARCCRNWRPRPRPASACPPIRSRRYLLKREELGSTGIGHGVAIPHARLPDLQRPYGLLAKLKQPIDFDAIDGQAVDIVFCLVCCRRRRSTESSAALALVARTLRSPDNARAFCVAAKNASELYSAIA